ncbi:MAG TPA: hypothetical protein VMW09_04865 [Desulfatiglandales bacterium]|nr:hypothetical protein [Desulfatiglandales bacterium]
MNRLLRPHSSNLIMWNYIFFIAMLGTICLISSCENREEESQRQKKAIELKEKFQSLFGKPDQEIVALLAVKYNKDVQIIESIIDSYLSKTDTSYSLMKLANEKKKKGISSDEMKDKMQLSFYDTLALDKTAYFNEVVRISDQFSVEQSIVASILFDYKTWEATRSQGNSE